MKRSTLFAAFFMLAQLAFAGGLLTNTNQSAQFIRMMSRNASTGIDAVYFNPAGLVKMEDGWHFAVYNQTILQSKPVESGFPLFENGRKKYDGEVMIPAFPTAFGVYKMDDWAFSLGFGPNGGGGSAVYDNGLPSFEKQISALPALVSDMGVPTTAYDVAINFKGSSVFWGIQAGAAYELNDFFAVSAGVRYLPSVNTYEGSIKDIMINPQHPQINPSGEMMPATEFFEAAGQPEAAEEVKDKEVDTKQTGSGFTPMVGVNISPVEELNIALKYEMQTNLELTNNTTVDEMGLFPDGAKTPSQIPAILGVGVGYDAGLIEAQVSYNMYFDKAVEWGVNKGDVAVWQDVDPSQIRNREIDQNGMELGLGLQFNVADNFAFSVGGLAGKMGVADNYQSDLDYSNPSITAGAGIEWKMTDELILDAGFSNTFYEDQTVSLSYPGLGEYSETYSKSTMTFAVGISYSIF